jgi:hypothetical protein
MFLYTVYTEQRILYCYLLYHNVPVLKVTLELALLVQVLALAVTLNV